MNHARLTILADFLDKVPDRKFDLSQWVQFGPPSNPAQLPEGDPLEKTCGFVACAVGWACTLPEFKAEGLRFGVNGPSFQSSTSWPAVMEFFGLSGREAEYLFSILAYPRWSRGPKDVAARIRVLQQNFLPESYK